MFFILGRYYIFKRIYKIIRVFFFFLVVKVLEEDDIFI